MFAAFQPVRSELSIFELNRRLEKGDDQAKKALNRERLLNDIISLQKIAISLLLIAISFISVVVFGWLIGTIISTVVAIFYNSIARLGFIRKLSKKFYDLIEQKLLSFIKKHKKLFSALRGVFENNQQMLGSRQELQHLMEQSTGILTPDEKSLIIHGLSFNDQLVSTIMTPRESIDSIKKTEFLGPLILDELHKTGHSKLPVIGSDLDHIVGILHLEGLLALDIKRSVTAEKAMEPKVFYINQNQTLSQALMEFVSTRHYLLIVVGSDRKTVGLLTLNDVIEALIGHKIVDEFDSHDSLKIVASRK